MRTLLKHNLDNITSQKWGGARHIGEPHDHKLGGGLEPLGPIGVHAYAPVIFSPTMIIDKHLLMLEFKIACVQSSIGPMFVFRSESNLWLQNPINAVHGVIGR